MFEKRPKLFFFMSGLIIGLLLGGIVVYFNSVVTNQNKISVNLIPGIVRQVLEAVKSNVPFRNNDENDSLAIARSVANSRTQPSLQVKNSTTDTSLQAEATFDDEVSDSTLIEEEVIRKDVLLSSFEIQVLNADAKTQNRKDADSLISQVSETRTEPQRADKFTMLVEHWSNPLNFRGYRVTKNKIVLFGLDPEFPVHFIYYKGLYYMKYEDGLYVLNETEDFMPFEKENDAEITAYLERLKI